MSKRMTLSIVLVTALLIVAGGYLFAQGPGGKGRHGMGMRDCFDDLKLTPEQEAKIIDQKFAHKQEMLPIQRDMQKKRLELKAELDKDAPSQTALDRISDELTALQGKMKKSKLHFLLSIRSILTKEQWQEAKENFMERPEGGPGMNHPPMDMGPGRGTRRTFGAPPDAPAPPPPPPQDED